MNAGEILGLDLSLTATGVADVDGVEVLRTKATGVARLSILRDAVMTAVGGRVRLVVIEGYSIGTQRQASHAHALGELGGVVRLALFEKGVAYVEVAPARLKKFATGKGNAPKDAVLTAAVRAGFPGDDNNAADAWWLREMGRYAYGCALVKHTVFRDEAVKSVDWPAARVEAAAP